MEFIQYHRVVGESESWVEYGSGYETGELSADRRITLVSQYILLYCTAVHKLAYIQFYTRSSVEIQHI